MSYLVLSIIALFIGPLVAPMVRGRRWLISGLDGFVLASVGAVTCIELLPSALESGGFWALAAIGLGIALPSLIERHSEASHDNGVGRGLVALVILGLAVHAALDGSALALHAMDPASSDAESLALAVLFHRLPVGFVIAWLAPSAWPMRRVLGLAFVVGLMTFFGFAMGQQLLGALDSFGLALFEATVAGTLLHVVLVHSPSALRLSTKRTRLSAIIGVGLGFLSAALAVHSGGHEHGAEGHESEVWSTFWLLATESAPALVAAFVGAGLLRVFMGEGLLRWLSRGRAAMQALRGMVFGLPLPICSCGVVPLYEGLIRAGTPPAAALAFLVATPEIGLGAVLISVPLLGVELTILRVLCAIVAAWLVAVVTVQIMPVRQVDRSDVGLDFQSDASLSERALSGLTYGLKDLVEDVMPWVIVGLGIAALLEPLLDASGLRELSPWIQVPLAGLMGMPVYVCASGSTPIVAVLLFSGLSPGAGIAFLLTGPATNIVTFGLLSSLHGRRVAIVFGVMMAAMACSVGWLANLWSPELSGVAGHGLEHAEDPSFITQLCLVALVALTLAALIRKGPRALIAKVVSPHDHGHHHHHVHLDGEGHSGASCCPGEGAEKGGCEPEPEPESSGGCCH